MASFLATNLMNCSRTLNLNELQCKAVFNMIFEGFNWIKHCCLVLYHLPFDEETISYVQELLNLNESQYQGCFQPDF